MQRLLSFPIKDSKVIQKLREASMAAPANRDAQIALALALIRAGCTYEAASILRPLRSHWAASKNAALAQEAIAAQAWWTKNWRDFARLMTSGNVQKALALLGDRATDYWDLPSLLIHLGGIAADDDQTDIARHLFERVTYLSERRLPKMNMQAFG